MPSSYVEKRRGPRGMRYRAVLEWWENGNSHRVKDKWTKYWKRAKKKSEDMMGDAEDIRLGIKKPIQRRSWGQLAASYEAHCRQDRQITTWLNWAQYAVRYFTEFLKGDSPVTAITTDQVREFRTSLETRERPLAANTVAAYGRHLTAVFNYAIALGWMRENPAVGVPWPRYEPGGQVVSESTLRAILACARPRLVPLAWLDYNTGLRSGESVNLDHRQLNRTKFYVSVVSHKRLKSKTGWKPKTLTSQRLVPILPKYWPLFGPEKPEGCVFQGYSGSPRERVNQVSKDFRDACKAAAEKHPKRADEFKGITFHHLKHTFCTNYLANGGSTAKLSEITGTSEATLKRTYAHLIGRVTLEDMRVTESGPLPKFHPKAFLSDPRKRDDAGRFSSRKSKAGDGTRTHNLPLTKRVSGAKSLSQLSAYHVCPLCGHPVNND
jgi:integrase